MNTISYVLTILIIILIIYYINVNGRFMEKKDEIKLYIFDFVSVCFLLLFVFYGYLRGTKYGFMLSVFIWAVFVCTTPIPEAALLLSFPLKNFFNIPMDISQVFISIFALLLLFLFYVYYTPLLKTIIIGKMFHKIINLRLFTLFVYSIIASVAGAYILDRLIDLYLFKSINTTNWYYVIIALIIMVFLNIAYFYEIIHYKITLTK